MEQIVKKISVYGKEMLFFYSKSLAEVNETSVDNGRKSFFGGIEKAIPFSCGKMSGHLKSAMLTQFYVLPPTATKARKHHPLSSLSSSSADIDRRILPR